VRPAFSPINQHETDCIAVYLLLAGFLPGLFFDPEDGSDMFLQKVC
jgi:hypothetical protein